MAKQLDHALKCFKEMIFNIIKPNKHTFGILMNILSKQGKLKETKVVINILIQHGFKLDLISYTTLIDGYFLVKNVEKTMLIFYSMTKNEMILDTHAYTIALKCLCKMNLCVKATQLLKEMHANGVTANVIS